MEAKMRIERIITCFADKPLADWVLGRGTGDWDRTSKHIGLNYAAHQMAYARTN